MPRRPRPENLENPLRVLRGLLSEHGHQKPISQLELSRLIRVSASSIRSIENGDRALTDNVLIHAVIGTGAWWDEKRKRWVYWWSDEEAPYTHADFLDYRENSGRGPESANEFVALLLAKMAMLFEQVSDRDWNHLFFRTQHFYDESRKEFELKGISDHPASERFHDLCQKIEQVLVRVRFRKRA